MIRILFVEAPDALASDVDVLIERLSASLRAGSPQSELQPDVTEEGSVEKSAPHPNKLLVLDLQRRLKLAGTPVKTYDVVNVSGVDPPRFYKWQKGCRVSVNARRACLSTVRLSVAEFVKRLNTPAEQKQK